MTAWHAIDVIGCIPGRVFHDRMTPLNDVSPMPSGLSQERTETPCGRGSPLVSGIVGGLPRYHWLVSGPTVVRVGTAHEPGDETTIVEAPSTGWITPLQAMASIGAGAIHAAAVGIHAEHATLSRLFVAVAAAQILVGLVTLVRGGRAVAAATALVNGFAVVAWLVTRVSGISWVEGLEQSEAPQFTDTVCAALGAIAAGAALVSLRGGASRAMRATPTRLGLPAIGAAPSPSRP